MVQTNGERLKKGIAYRFTDKKYRRKAVFGPFCEEAKITLNSEFD